MKLVFRIIPMILAVLLVVFGSILSLASEPVIIDNKLTVATLVAAQGSDAIEGDRGVDGVPFQDNLEVYKDDAPGSVVTIFITIKSDGHNGWDSLNDYGNLVEEIDQTATNEEPEVIVQFGDDTGPLPAEFGYGDILPNATIETRGANSAFDPQKSYKITLFNNSGTWRGQSVINLNKHLSDETRFRNKLSLDLMKQIPHMVSLRTQFIHLYVRDESTNDQLNGFVDYGLFTQVEQPNKRFLENHHLDRDGQLYKAENFLFNEYPDAIRLVTDPLFDENAFSQLLEIRGSNDHSKLIQMLHEVNNEDIPIEQTFEKYFDSENYFTWMAFNILSGNVDVISENYLLYSPKNGNRWYFIPWDYDKAFPLQTDPELSTKYYLPWQNGVSNYWGSTLHRRVLQEDQYRNMLDRKLDELLLILYPEYINSFIDLYQPVVDKYSFVMPDAYHMPVDKNTSYRIANLLSSEIDTNYNLYVKSLEEPMPFSLGSPVLTDDKLSFSWGKSYDLGDRPIKYEFEISKDWGFNEIIYRQSLVNTAVDIPFNLLTSGKYFWRVAAINSLGSVQYSYDYYIDGNSEIHPGVKVFYLTAEGMVLE